MPLDRAADQAELSDFNYSCAVLGKSVPKGPRMRYRCGSLGGAARECCRGFCGPVGGTPWEVRVPSTGPGGSPRPLFSSLLVKVSSSSATHHTVDATSSEAQSNSPNFTLEPSNHEPA